MATANFACRKILVLEYLDGGIRYVPTEIQIFRNSSIVVHYQVQISRQNI